MNLTKYLKLFGFLIVLGPLVSCNVNNKLYNVNDFGAVGDSTIINTKAIQSAIDACSKNGGGTVLISKGIYISGTVLLKNNVTLHIDENSKLVGSSNPIDYQSIDTFIDATGQERGTCLIGAMNAKNIGIVGKGIIDGNGAAFLQKNLIQKMKTLGIEETKNFGKNRPFLLRFVKSSKINLKDITLKQAAAWACHFYQSNSIIVNNITIYNHANKNNDGIDLDSSHDAVITHCNINSEDDAICIKSTSPLPTYNVKIDNCNLKSDWGAIKFGTESMGDFYNIDIRNSKVYDTKGGGIKILSVDGANIHNITIDSIEMNNVDMPIFIRLGERLRTYRDSEIQPVGSITDIKISNVNAVTRSLEHSRVNPPTGIFITGTPNHKIGTINLENIKIKLPGGGLKANVVEVLEDEKKYPEFTFFGVLPAYGIYGRHIENLNIGTTTFNIATKDERKSIIFDDVESHVIDRSKLKAIINE
ncbi:glycoside hydrolase family 28 protein [Flavivirga rizhaonensis]|uniref:Glycoside hydrolase family 28 protein n=1 Tax=Flavivirga rizhaonensis TaxID=2559571 RepID=A0A4S1DU67_9FLAO|nr:glycosyl hydrolase family 28 protein [Flavivirga rizhaonensis]TGV00978.1 glycoside hydrolase family 28 protein [Flavivirga rizhaonensis]